MKNLSLYLSLMVAGTAIVACGSGSSGSSSGGGNQPYTPTVSSTPPVVYSATFTSGANNYELTGESNIPLSTGLPSQTTVFKLTNTTSGATSISENISFTIVANDGTSGNLPTLSPASCDFESTTDNSASCVITIQQNNNTAGSSYSIVPTPVGHSSLAGATYYYVNPITTPTEINMNGVWGIITDTIDTDHCVLTPYSDTATINGQTITFSGGSSGSYLNPRTFPYTGTNIYGGYFYQTLIGGNTLLTIDEYPPCGDLKLYQYMTKISD